MPFVGMINVRRTDLRCLCTAYRIEFHRRRVSVAPESISPIMHSCACVKTRFHPATGMVVVIVNRHLHSTDKEAYHRRQQRRPPPVPPPGELSETFASSLILAHWLHYVKTRRHPQNRKYVTY